MTASSWPECLGSTADEIAKTLRELGVKGRRRSCRTCPVAMSYYRLAPDKLSDKVTVLSVSCTDKTNVVQTRALIEINNAYLRVDDSHREAIGKFIQRFDSGEFPDLDIAKEQS